jgi:hypothetical protein
MLQVSRDLYRWQPKCTLFTGRPSTRDPNLLLHDGKYLLTYVLENYLVLRTSTDLIHLSNAEKIFRMDGEGVPESPFMVNYDNVFYLFGCICEGSHWFQKRTFCCGVTGPRAGNHMR